MKRLATILLTLWGVITCGLHAQDGELLEYQQEIGGGVGIYSYVGDAGGGFFSHPGPMGVLLWRRNFNPRMVLKTNLGFGRLNGTTEGIYIPKDPWSKTAAGGVQAVTINFGRKIVDAGAQFELNFLGYGMGERYKGLHRWTPYLLAGAGVTVAFGFGGKTAAGLNIPLGVGFRYKLKHRLNIGLEWAFRFTTSDKLDDTWADLKLNDPYGIESGTFKNKDCYQTLFVSLTYDISPKYRKCNN